MKASFSCAVVVLLSAALPAHSRKFPPPGDCSQQLLGWPDKSAELLEYDEAGRIPGALDASEGRGEPGSKVDPSTAVRLRARNLKGSVSPSDWKRLASAWDRYIAARVDTARIVNRLCSGGLLARSLAFDVAYVVLAPFEIIGAFSPDENGDAQYGLLLLPVGGAIGLASDAALTVASPVAFPAMKLKAGRRSRRQAAALKEFGDLVVELEGANLSGKENIRRE